MIKLSKSGVVITGIAAFYLINKGLNVIRDASKEFADAIRWRSYYKCGREDPLAPHYERRTSDPESRKDGGNPPKKDISNDPKERFLKGVADGITTSATKAINEAFSKAEGPKTADFGDLKGVSEDEKIKPTNHKSFDLNADKENFKFITKEEFDHYLNALETSQVTDDKSNNQEKE